MAHSIEYSLKKAKKMLRNGRIDEAKTAFESILIAFPGNIRAQDGLKSCELMAQRQPLNNGEAQIILKQIDELFSAGKHDLVIQASNQFLTMHPNDANVLLKLGASLGTTGEFEKAKECFYAVAELQPNDPAPYNNLGTVWKMQNDISEAMSFYRKALEKDPAHFDSLKNISFCYDKLNDKENAIFHLKKAIDIKPDSAELINHLGSLYSKSGNNLEAEQCYKRVLDVNPNFKQALNNLGNIEYSRQAYEKAIALYEKAIACDPDYGDAYNNLANVLKDTGYLDEAIMNYEIAIKFQPEKAELHSNHSVALKDKFELEKAMSAIEKALELDDSMADGHWNKSLIQLAGKNYQDGWKNYEWRWKATNFDSTYLKTEKPLWDGKRERVLIWQEQGIGDQIMFSTMFEEFATFCELPIFQVDRRLLPIFRRSFPAFHFIPGDMKLAENEYDSHIPMGSMSKYLRKNEADFLNANPSKLSADLISAQKIRQAFRIGEKCLVGISWRSVNKSTGVMRSVALETFLKPFKGKDVELVNLQYGDCSTEINQAFQNTGVQVKSVNEIDTFSNIDHLASLIQCCDRVITIDNSTVHLAASMGKPTDLILPFVTDWRWCGGERIPMWYDCLTVHRAPYGIHLNDCIYEIIEECLYENSDRRLQKA